MLLAFLVVTTEWNYASRLYLNYYSTAFAGFFAPSYLHLQVCPSTIYEICYCLLPCHSISASDKSPAVSLMTAALLGTAALPQGGLLALARSGHSKNVQAQTHLHALLVEGRCHQWEGADIASAQRQAEERVRSFFLWSKAFCILFQCKKQWGRPFSESEIGPPLSELWSDLTAMAWWYLCQSMAYWTLNNIPCVVSIAQNTKYIFLVTVFPAAREVRTKLGLYSPPALALAPNFLWSSA